MRKSNRKKILAGFMSAIMLFTNSSMIMAADDLFADDLYLDNLQINNLQTDNTIYSFINPTDGELSRYDITLYEDYSAEFIGEEEKEDPKDYIDADNYSGESVISTYSLDDSLEETYSGSVFKDSNYYNTDWEIYSSYYIYNKLTDGKKKVWDALDEYCRKALDTTYDCSTNSNGKGVIGYIMTSEFETVSDYAAFIFMYKYLNPQYFFLSSTYSYSQTSDGIKMSLIIYDNMIKGSQRAKYITNFTNGINDMKSQIAVEDKSSSDYEEKMVKKIHDVICNQVSYDQTSVDTKHVNEQTEYTQSAYSTFVRKTTVCAGYSLAFELLCNYYGIECIAVSAPGHAYNKVRVNDSWYNVDSTWDDQKSGIIYLYYLRSDASYAAGTNAANHTTDPEWKEYDPICVQDSNSTMKEAKSLVKPSAKVANPVITYKGGKLCITYSDADSVYYTIDGIEPQTSGTKAYIYKGPATIDDSVTVKAVAVKDGCYDSDIVEKHIDKNSVSQYTKLNLDLTYPTKEEIISYIDANPVDYDEEVTYSETPVTSGTYSPGKLSTNTENAALSYLNRIRYIAGLNADVTINSEYSKKAQAASFVNYLNNSMSHTPAKPSGVSDELYSLAYSGASSSNLGGGYDNINKALLVGWLGDSNSSNISAVGHRRWILNPTMSQTGFGEVHGTNTSQSAMYAFDKKNTSDAQTVIWPAVNTPTQLMNNSYAWSISVRESVAGDDISVQLVRNSTGKTWNFSKENSDGFFNLSDAYYGSMYGCIIFRPEGIGTYNDGDTFTVTVTNHSKETILTYTVTFFDIDDSGMNSNQIPGIKWSIDDGGILRLSGNGSTPEISLANDIPWYASRDSIKVAIVEDGIKDMYSGFAFFNNIETVVFPSTLEKLGIALYSCGVKNIIFTGDSQQMIYSNVFSGVNATVYYPDKLKHPTEGQYAGNVTWKPYCSLIDGYKVREKHLYVKGECQYCGMVDANYVPETTTKQPETTTKPQETTTAKPQETTTTKPQETTTAKPQETTTAKPQETTTTKPQETTTAKPQETTTTKPQETTTAKPQETTTTKPQETTTVKPQETTTTKPQETTTVKPQETTTKQPETTTNTEDITYKITYVLNGGVNNASNPSNYKSNSPSINLMNASRKGYTFGGWYTDSALKSKITNIVAGTNRDITIYAKWNLVTYKVQYVLNGGANNKKNIKSYNVNDKVFVFKNAIRTGYTFAGWYLDKNFKVRVKNVSGSAVKNLVLYAKWTVNKYNIKFNANGGKGTMAVMKNISYGKKVRLSANKFTKKGYKFLGFSTDKKAKKVKYVNKARVKNLTTLNKKTVILYAIWKTIKK